jgi:ATPase subunit of ABC transporter with duplicated ATPase domains
MVTSTTASMRVRIVSIRLYSKNGGTTMSSTNTARYKYTPDEMSETEFLNRFVVRHEVFEEIFEELKEADYSVPNQHYIIIGQRGQGKTTLLRKLKIEVEKDKKLSKFLLPVKFSEEQYRVRQLCRFWEEVADYLQTYYEEIYDGLLDEIEEHIDDENYPAKCFSYLEKKLSNIPPNASRHLDVLPEVCLEPW